MRSHHVMVARRDAAQATLDRFQDVPHTWGRFDCAKMVAFHLRQLGYRVGISKAGVYSTPLGAKRALVRLGWPTLSHALDEVLQLPRIGFASVIVGDVLQLPSEDGMDALAIALGNGRALGYHPDVAGAVVVQPIEITAAWRVVPK